MSDMDLENDSESYFRLHHREVVCTGIVGVVSSLSHLSMERDRWLRGTFSRVLEVGGGQGQHHRYVKHDFSTYLLTDLFPELLSEANPIAGMTIETDSIDVQRLPFQDRTFDRVIATCLLAHVPDLQSAVSELVRVLRHNGVLTIYLPCEPGMLLRIVQFLTTRRRQKRLGLNPHLTHYREHRNHFPGMIEELKNAVQIDSRLSLKLRRFPFPFLSWNFNLWVIVHIKSLS